MTRVRPATITDMTTTKGTTMTTEEINTYLHRIASAPKGMCFRTSFVKFVAEQHNRANDMKAKMIAGAIINELVNAKLVEEIKCKSVGGAVANQKANDRRADALRVIK